MTFPRLDLDPPDFKYLWLELRSRKQGQKFALKPHSGSPFLRKPSEQRICAGDRRADFRKNTFTNEGDQHIQYYNRHFGFVLRPAHSGRLHEPLSSGLHHFCFRVEDVATVDAVARRFAEDGVSCSSPQLYPEYASDYYALFFSDPDGTRLEITNYRRERRKRFEDWEHA